MNAVKDSCPYTFGKILIIEFKCYKWFLEINVEWKRELEDKKQQWCFPVIKVEWLLISLCKNYTWNWDWKNSLMHD